MQPGGSWWPNTTGVLVSRDGGSRVDAASTERRTRAYVGSPAHTTNDSIIHIPDRSVVFTGDLLFNGGTPFALMGSISGRIGVRETAQRPLGAQTLGPGHGPVCGPEGSDDMLAYPRFVQDVARQAKTAGPAPL